MANQGKKCLLPEFTNDEGKPEIYAGADGAMFHPGLVSMHTLFLRLHNHIASRIKALRPNACDEEIFQETRRIVIAILQSITYQEMLPLILGETGMTNYNLKLQSSNVHTTDYDVTFNPSLYNAFSSAAFRFGHSMVSEKLDLSSGSSIDLSSTFNNFSSSNTEGMYPSDYLKSLASQPTEPIDPVITDALRNFLFTKEGDDYGEDLLSLNIQRGRDHGIPSYQDYRKECGLETVSSIDDLDFEDSTIQAIKTVYK